MLTRRLRNSESQGDAGFTLVELLVSIVILGVVSAIVSVAIISSLRTSRVAEANVLSATEARIVLERTSLDIRTADPLVAASANSITLDTFRKGQCERRTYRLSSGQLLLDVAGFGSGVACGVYGSTPGAVTTTVVADGLTNTTAAPLFRYFRWSSTTNTRTAVSAPVAAASMGQVDGVEVRVGIVAREQDDVGLSTLVDLRNVELK